MKAKFSLCSRPWLEVELAHENTLTLRGLSLRLLKKYLGKMGAQEISNHHFSGEGWSVTMSVSTVRVLKSDMDEIEVVFDGNPDAVRDAIAELRKKTFRGGG
jgi:hypothetical protein